MFARTLINASAAAAPTPVPVSLINSDYFGVLGVHVTISLAGSVQMQGRNSPTMAWTNMGSAITTTGIITLPMCCAEVQAVLTGNTGIVSCAIVH